MERGKSNGRMQIPNPQANLSAWLEIFGSSESEKSGAEKSMGALNLIQLTSFWLKTMDQESLDFTGSYTVTLRIINKMPQRPECLFQSFIRGGGHAATIKVGRSFICGHAATRVSWQKIFGGHEATRPWCENFEIDTPLNGYQSMEKLKRYPPWRQNLCINCYGKHNQKVCQSWKRVWRHTEWRQDKLHLSDARTVNKKLDWMLSKID